MYPRDRYILGDAHIHVLLPADVDLLLVAKGDKLEDLPLLAASLPHHLEDDVGAFWFGDVDGVEFLVVQVDPVLVVGLAHLAEEGLPVDGHAEVVDHCLDLLGQPLLQAEQVDVLYCSCAFARSY